MYESAKLQNKTEIKYFVAAFYRIQSSEPACPVETTGGFTA